MEPPTPVTLENVVDRLQIDDLLTRYARAIDENDWDLMVSLFTDDAVWDLSRCGGIKGSPADVAAWVGAHVDAWPVNQHFIVNRDVRISGDTATGKSYFWNVMSRPGADGAGNEFLTTGGFYYDRYRRTERGWLIEQRGEDLAWFQGEWPQDVERPQ
jgi:hypothetical protein